MPGQLFMVRCEGLFPPMGYQRSQRSEDKRGQELQYFIKKSHKPMK